MRRGSATLRDSGSESARLDAELLRAHVLGVERTSILAEPDVPIGDGSAATFGDLIARRAKGEPVAYIRCLKEFYGLAFAVDPRALIPRPETETLVALALDRLVQMLVDAPRPSGADPLLVWDVGTGSGAVAVAVAVECRRRGYGADIRLLATDASPDALALAVENAVAHGVADAIDFATADLCQRTIAGHGQRRAHVLLANLPYIPSADVPGLPVAASFEPRLALDGGADGLELLGRLLVELPGALAPGGVALLEIGADQPSSLEDKVGATLPGWRLAIHHDLSGSPRVAELSRAATQ